MHSIFKSLLLIILIVFIFSGCDNSPSNDTTITQEDSTTTKTTTTKKKGKNELKVYHKPNPYYKLEQYAFATPKQYTKTIGSLSSYLSKGGSTNEEKAMLAYAWVAKNINYDDHGYNTENYSGTEAPEVLKNRKAVCEGYSNLYKALCDSMGLQAVVIHGYAKGYSYTLGHKFKETNHAWNALMIDGKWKLVDATWGEGYGKTVKGKLKSVKQYDSYWFCTDPYEFLFKHLPEAKSKSFQLIDNPISLLQYEKLIYVDNGIFNLGLSAKSIMEKSLANPAFSIPEAWARDYKIELVQLELYKNLVSGREYNFKLKCNENLDVAFVNQGDWNYFTKEGEYYSGTVKPGKGELTINIRHNGYENNYSTILSYGVK